jgi:hypothetical protein
MNKKNIQLGVVVVAFLAMGIILYKGFFAGSGGSSAAAPAPIVNTASLTPTSILPYGSDFDYQKVDALVQQGFQYGQIQYPVVSTSTDVGKDVSDLIAPLPAVGTGQ